MQISYRPIHDGKLGQLFQARSRDMIVSEIAAGQQNVCQRIRTMNKINETESSGNIDHIVHSILWSFSAGPTSDTEGYCCLQSSEILMTLQSRASQYN